LQQCPNGAYCLRQNLDCNEEYCVCPSYNVVHNDSPNEHPVQDHSVHATHCDPSTLPLQQCPNGAYCVRQNLDCNEEYCVCDSHYEHPVYEHPVYEHPVYEHHEHTVYEHTVYEHPVHEHTVYEHPVYEHPVHEHTVYEHPVYEHPVPEDPVYGCEDLLIQEDMYNFPQWIHHCPEIHCDPYAKRMQVCPNGQLCLKGHLYCNTEYCICGTHHDNPNLVENLAHCHPHSTQVQYCPNGHVCNPDHLICVEARNTHTYCICPSY
jgi:hypothetical protein